MREFKKLRIFEAKYLDVHFLSFFNFSKRCPVRIVSFYESNRRCYHFHKKSLETPKVVHPLLSFHTSIEDDAFSWTLPPLTNENLLWLQKSVKEWKLLPPYDTKNVNWKDYYDTRKQLDDSREKGNFRTTIVVNENERDPNMEHVAFFKQYMELKSQKRSKQRRKRIYAEYFEKIKKLFHFPMNPNVSKDTFIDYLLRSFPNRNLYKLEPKQLLDSIYLREIVEGDNGFGIKPYIYSLYGNGRRVKLFYRLERSAGKTQNEIAKTRGNSFFCLDHPPMLMNARGHWFEFLSVLTTSTPRSTDEENGGEDCKSSRDWGLKKDVIRNGHVLFSKMKHQKFDDVNHFSCCSRLMLRKLEKIIFPTNQENGVEGCVKETKLRDLVKFFVFFGGAMMRIEYGEDRISTGGGEWMLELAEKWFQLPVKYGEEDLELEFRMFDEDGVEEGYYRSYGEQLVKNEPDENNDGDDDDQMPMPPGLPPGFPGCNLQ